MRTGRSPAPRRTGTSGGRLGLYPCAPSATDCPRLMPWGEVPDVRLRISGPWLMRLRHDRPRHVGRGVHDVRLEVRPPSVVLADSTARALIRTLALEGADYIHFILPTCGIHMAQVPLPHHHTCRTSGIQWGSNAPRCLRNGA